MQLVLKKLLAICLPENKAKNRKIYLVVPTGQSSNFLVEDLLLIIAFESFLSLPGVINADSIEIKKVSVRIYNKLDD